MRTFIIGPHMRLQEWVAEENGYFHDSMDTRRFGLGERSVFEPYTQAMFEATRAWIERWQIVPDDHDHSADYAEAVAGGVS